MREFYLNTKYRRSDGGGGERQYALLYIIAQFIIYPTIYIHVTARGGNPAILHNARRVWEIGITTSKHVSIYIIYRYILND